MVCYLGNFLLTVLVVKVDFHLVKNISGKWKEKISLNKNDSTWQHDARHFHPMKCLLLVHFHQIKINIDSWKFQWLIDFINNGIPINRVLTLSTIDWINQPLIFFINGKLFDNYLLTVLCLDRNSIILWFSQFPEFSLLFDYGDFRQEKSGKSDLLYILIKQSLYLHLNENGL